MKLVILTQYYPPEVGAPQARLSEIAAHFVQSGHSVTVLTAMPNYPTGKIHAGYGGVVSREERDGVEIIRTFIYPSQQANFVRRLTNYFSFVFSSAIVGTLLLKPPDYLLVESPPLFLGLSGFWLSRLKRTRLIFNVSDLWPESAVRLGMLRTGSLSFRLSEWLEAFCYRRAWLVTGQSNSILASIADRFPTRPTFHLSNGTDTNRFSPERRTDAARATLENGNCDGSWVVLYAGLHGLAQGLEQVLDTAEQLGTESGVRFVLVGDGPEKKGLIEAAERRKLTNVCFLDPRPAHEIPALLASADAVLVTLKSYIPGAVPSKLYEAMASGRPLVLVASGEAAEVVRKNQAGIVVEPGDIEGLTRALATLRADPDYGRTLGANGRRAVEADFNRSKIVKRFILHLEANLHRADASRNYVKAKPRRLLGAAASSRAPLVSILMPIRNEAAFIERSLGAVLGQDYGAARMEVIVADGMSTDGTREIVRSLQTRHPNLRLIDNPGRIVSTGLNTALGQARGEFLVRVDGHCEVAPDYVRRCIEHLLDDGVDGVGGIVETVGDSYLAQIIAVSMSSPFGVGNSNFRTARNVVIAADTVPFPAYSRAIVEQGGLFDEELLRNQDDEYNYRLRKLGAKIVLAPQARARYYCRRSLRSLWQQYFQYGFWKVRVMQKHLRQMRARQFVPPIFVLVLLITLLLAPFSVVGRWIFASVVGLYLVATLAASILTARKEGWQMLPMLPVTFAILHLAYGVGFLVGLGKFWNRWKDHEVRLNQPQAQDAAQR